MAAALVFGACFAFWLLLSGHLAPLELTLGAAAAALVTALHRREERLSAALRALPRLLAYLPWLLREIVRANLQVARLVLHPRLPIDPVLVRLEPRLEGDLALATLANSITLTPGTVTVDVDGRALVVHALTPAGAAALPAGAMARRVGRVFGEPGA